MRRHPFSPTLAATFLSGLALLIAGQLVSGSLAAAALVLTGGALLVAVLIRGLAALAGLHRAEPELATGERLLVESQGVMVGPRAGWLGGSRGPYRARLTDRRILLSLRIMLVTTQRDVTIAWLDAGRPLSVRSITIDGQRLTIHLARRFGGTWRLDVPDAAAWQQALRESHPALLLPSGLLG